MRILIADDNEQGLYLLETLLKESQYEVICAKNGQDAFEKLESNSIEMIISDTLMPVMDGFMLCHKIKTNDRFKKIPFIFYSATYKEKEDIELAFKLGAAKYIIKPAEPAELLKEIQEVIKEVNAGKFDKPSVFLLDNKEIYRLYSERLIKKLEHMVFIRDNELVKSKQAEEALRKEREFNDNIISTARIIILVLDPKGCIVSFNPYMEQLSGYRLEEVRGKDWFETFLPKEDQAKISELFKRAVNNMHTKGSINPIIAKDGHKIEVEWNDNTIKDIDGSTIGVLAIGQDITERKKAQEKINYLATFPALNPNPICEIDVNGNTIYRNPASLELKNKGLICPCSFSSEEIKDFFSGKKEKIFREIKSGDKWYLQLMQLIPETKNIRIYNTDITERKKIEEALRDSEEKYRNLYNSILDGLVLVDMQGKVLDCNSAYAGMLGYTIEEVKKLTYIQLTPEKWHAMEAEIVGQKIIKTGYSSLYEKEYIRKDGTVFPIDIRVWLINDEQGKPKWMWAIARDITERKKAQEALRVSEARYRSVVEVTQLIAWVTDSNGQIVEDVPLLRKFSGQSYEEAKGSGWAKALHPDDLKRVLAVWNKAVSEKSNYEVEYRMRRNDGVYRYLLARGFPVFKEDGSVLEWVGVCIDITERKKAEEELARYRGRLEEGIRQASEKLQNTYKELEDSKRLSDIGTLAATIAHELRNPLGVIKTAVYNIKRKTTDRSLDSHLNNINMKIDESDQIIKNLLSYSRLKLPHYEDVRLLELLKMCITNCQNKYAKWDVKTEIIKSNCQPDNMINIDPVHLNEVFSNILDNAYQSFMDKNGRIEISFDCNMRENKVMVIFKDNGCGIDKKDIEKITDPFFTTKARGIGLGLTVCKEVINLHKGKLDISSVKGEGTTVTVSLPVKRES